jgi:hypothetical protein
MREVQRAERGGPIEAILSLRTVLREQRLRANTKNQTPSSRKAPNTKSQAPKVLLPGLGAFCVDLFWSLVLGISLVFGFWSLVFPVRICFDPLLE